MVRPSAILFVEVNASQQALKRLLTPGGELVRLRWRRRRRRRRRRRKEESDKLLTFSNRFPLSFLHSLSGPHHLSPRSARRLHPQSPPQVIVDVQRGDGGGQGNAGAVARLWVLRGKSRCNAVLVAFGDAGGEEKGDRWAILCAHLTGQSAV